MSGKVWERCGRLGREWSDGAGQSKARSGRLGGAQLGLACRDYAGLGWGKGSGRIVYRPLPQQKSSPATPFVAKW